MSVSGAAPGIYALAPLALWALALALLVLGVLTNDHDLPLALDDFALLANFLHRRSYFHFCALLWSGIVSRPAPRPKADLIWNAR